MNTAWVLDLHVLVALRGNALGIVSFVLCRRALFFPLFHPSSCFLHSSLLPTFPLSPFQDVGAANAAQAAAVVSSIHVLDALLGNTMRRPDQFKAASHWSQKGALRPVMLNHPMGPSLGGALDSKWTHRRVMPGARVKVRGVPSQQQANWPQGALMAMQYLSGTSCTVQLLACCSMQRWSSVADLLVLLRCCCLASYVLLSNTPWDS